MKNSRFYKITLLAITLALVIGSILLVNASAETNETKPEIISQNVSYSTNLAVNLAVDATTATAPIKLYRFDTEPTDGEVGTLVATSSEFVAADSNVNNLPKDSYVIQAPGVAASDIAHYYYYKVVDANGNESDIFRYSVAEYLYERLATAGITDTQKNLYNATLIYGDAAQIQFNSTDPSVSTLNLVTVTEGGALSDGYAQGLYATGATATPSGAGVTKWTVNTYDADGNVTTQLVNNGAEFEVSGRTIILPGETRSYRAGTNDLEGLTLNAAPSGVGLNITTPVSGVITTDKVYGRTSKVLQITAGGTSGFLGFAKSGSAAGATGYEISFDIKIPTTGSMWKFSDSPVGCVLQIMNKGGELVFRYNKSPYTYAYTGVSAEVYNHIRMVYKAVDGEEGKYNTYIYVNGSDTPIVFSEMVSTVAPSSITAGTFVRFAPYVSGGTNYATGSVYFDNVFNSFIKD